MKRQQHRGIIELIVMFERLIINAIKLNGIILE